MENSRKSILFEMKKQKQWTQVAHQAEDELVIRDRGYPLDSNSAIADAETHNPV